MALQKLYQRINWENYPSDATPLNESNLNKMDAAVYEIDDRVISLDTTKFNLSDAQTLIKSVAFDSATGVFTFTYYNGSTFTLDTLLEKIVTNWDYDETKQQLVITTEDGTVKYVDLSALIQNNEFLDSDTIAFTVNSSGKVTAIVKEGSIEEKHLQPTYLADITLNVAKAQASQEAAAASATAANASAVQASGSASTAVSAATEAESWAVGGTGTRDGEDTDNSKYYSGLSEGYMETAKLQVQEAQEIIDNAVDTINEAVANDVPAFQVDISTGHLLYNARFVFSVSSPDGHLLWEVA